MKTLKLERVGENLWGNMVYKGEDGKFYLDISMNHEKVPTELHTCHPADDMDGEPGYCVTSTFEIINPITDKERRENECKGLYMMLSRIYDDFSAYLGKTGDEEQDKWDCRYHNDKHGLWGDTVKETLEEIKRRWSAIPEDLKPKWCTAEDIAKLEQKAMEMNL